MIQSILGKVPQIHEQVFVAEGSSIIGDVQIEAHSSVWYNAVIRADVGPVVIQEGSNVQDGAVIHVSHSQGTRVGKGVTVGHNAIVHAATIGDYTLVGMGSIILDGAQIGKHCIIGAGALVTGGTIIEDGMLVLGSPAKVIKTLSEAQIQGLYESAEHYIELSKVYRQECQQGE
ncbi:MAG: gamma carbonic anhydrase family protein [Niameybacter sp.]|uniref:gamma carbonic anhydrase family protein n=1 Tax=Niameybacter sp. TaxID=2033640 RepID=UPI002FCAB7FF